MPLRVVNILKWVILAIGIFEMIITVIYGYFIRDKIRLFYKKDGQNLLDKKDNTDSSSENQIKHGENTPEIDNINIQEE
jgi:hypothetical protein